MTKLCVQPSKHSSDRPTVCLSMHLDACAAHVYHSLHCFCFSDFSFIDGFYYYYHWVLWVAFLIVPHPQFSVLCLFFVQFLHVNLSNRIWHDNNFWFCIVALIKCTVRADHRHLNGLIDGNAEIPYTIQQWAIVPMRTPFIATHRKKKCTSFINASQNAW